MKRAGLLFAAVILGFFAILSLMAPLPQDQRMQDGTFAVMIVLAAGCGFGACLCAVKAFKE